MVVSTSIEVSDIVAMIACVISIFCAFFSLWQAKTAKKAYDLQKKIYLDGFSHLELNIRDSFVYDDKNEEKLFIFFGIVVNNLSDKQTSIKKCVLSLLCEEDVIYKPSLSEKEDCFYKELSKFEIPQNLGAHSSHAGWLKYEVSREIYMKININTFVVCVEDIHGVRALDNAVFVREELHNYEIEKANQS